MSMLKRTCVVLMAAVVVAVGGASPAFAKKEDRIRTEALEIFFPKNIKAPKSGCSQVPIRYEWRYFLNHLSVGAYITLETKKEWAVSEVYLQPDFSGGAGVVNLKICSQRWVGEEETIDGEVFPGDIYQGVKRGKYYIDVWGTDFDNKENSFQFPKRKPLQLK